MEQNTKAGTQLICPVCHRATLYLPKENGKRRTNYLKDTMVTAVNATGICYTDFRATREQVGSYNRKSSGVTNASLGLHNANYHTKKAMTDEEAERLRDQLRQMIRDRRARGVHPEGMDVAEWAHGNGGLYASEVP